jgi:FAD/FMN-containing dehydrogenase
MIQRSAEDRLRAALRGDLLTPGGNEYEASRKIFNAMIDRRPSMIARCVDAQDVMACLGFARDEGLRFSVRGGGHNVSGKALCDGGLVIDLTRMKNCRVDPSSRTVSAGPGLTLGELDRTTQAVGLATPLGNVSTTGIAGLTLGGGIGWLNGVHGLACDNLLSAEIATADGQLRIASEAEHPDLFWAVRGGGANLGVVTAFQYRLHEVGPLLGGGIAWPLERAIDVLPVYERLARSCPDPLSLNAGFFSAPDGTHLVGVSVAWLGPPEEGLRLLNPLRSVPGVVADGLAPTSYLDLQQSSDAAFPYGRRHYWKASFLRRLEPAAIDMLIRFARTAPSPHTLIGLQQMHGQAARVPATQTAFVHRHDQWDCLLLSQWNDPDADRENIGWTRDLHAALQPWLVDAVYVNDLGEEEGDRIRVAYGDNFERLVAVKARYDPDNFFRGNQNVAITAATR